MDMSWQALLQEAAATSFEKTADTLAAAENDNCACIDLHQQQIHELSKKILLLPHQGRVLLLSRYCFRLSPEETEMFFHLENAKGPGVEEGRRPLPPGQHRRGKLGKLPPCETGVDDRLRGSYLSHPADRL